MNATTQTVTTAIQQALRELEDAGGDRSELIFDVLNGRDDEIRRHFGLPDGTEVDALRALLR